jgi:hypothetical protein
MLQPTKDDLRSTIQSLRRERDSSRAQAASLTAELDEIRKRLDEACRLLGQQRVDASLAEQRATS